MNPVINDSMGFLCLCWTSYDRFSLHGWELVSMASEGVSRIVTHTTPHNLVPQMEQLSSTENKPLFYFVRECILEVPALSGCP